MRTVDVGIPSLSMHSIREQIGVEDIYTAHEIFKTFYKDFRALDDAIQLDGPPSAL